MILNLATARKDLAEYVDGGSCDEAVLDKRINEAVRWCLRKGDYQLDRYCIRTCDPCITLPHDVHAVRNAKVDCCESIVHSEWFEFMPGAGDAECWATCDITHKGSQYVTFAELPCPMYLMAVSDSCEDAGAAIFAQGTDQYGAPVRSTESGLTRFGEKILIEDPCKKWITRSMFKTVTYIDKPVTNGLVRLYGFLPECEAQEACMESNVFMIGYYLPWEQRPCYTRISVGTGRGPRNITMLVKRKWVQYSHPDQILAVHNLDALTEALLAFDARKSAKPVERREFERLAKEALVEEKDDKHSSQAEIAVDMYNPEVIV